MNGMNLKSIKEEFRPILVALEKKRKQNLSLYYIEFAYYFVGLGLLVGIILLLLSSLSLGYAGVFGVVFLSLLIIRHYHIGNPERQYQEIYENTFLKKIARALISTTELDNVATSFSKLKESGLLGGRNDGAVIDVFKSQVSETLFFQTWFLTGEQYKNSIASGDLENVYLVIDSSKTWSHRIMIRKEDWLHSSIEMDTGVGQRTHFNLYPVQVKSIGFNDKYAIYRKQNQPIQNLFTDNLLHGVKSVFDKWDELQRIVFLDNKVYLELKTIEHYLVGKLELPILEDYFLDYLCKDIRSNLTLVKQVHGVLEGYGKQIIDQNDKDNLSNNPYDHFMDPET